MIATQFRAALRWPLFFVLGCLAPLAAQTAAQAAEPPAKSQAAAHFDAQIAPLLVRRCLTCHSGGEPKGDLDLSSQAQTLAGGESGDAALVPGDPDESLLWQYVDADEMPPKHPLPDHEKQLLRAWIAGGATWGGDPIDQFKYTSEVRAGYDWWSLQPLTPLQPPSVKRPDWIRTPIDAFVLAGLEARDLQPAAEADRRTLIRRLSFDLIGLPPSPEEIAAFLADTSPDAYERLVDRLLASPHYGERWARHWLDVARFGESDGFEYDKIRPNAWPYRDWVVNALNNDLPYDEFTRWQLAGDALDPKNPSAVTATGFLVAGAFDGLIPAGDTMRKIMRQDELEDLVGTVSQTFLGLTVHCARCHDHKFDPIRQTEYYQLASALAGVRRGERDVHPTGQMQDMEQRLADLTAKLAALEAPVRAQILAARENNPNAASSAPPLPAPIASWDFSVDLKDQIGAAHGEPHGAAALNKGRLQLDGQTAYVATAPLDQPLAAKTLQAWVQLRTLEQGGGGVMSVQSLNGQTFDAIVFGEREPRRWMAGSNGFVRTQDFAGLEETQAQEQLVCLTLVYESDGHITAYRDGVPYGRAYQSKGLQEFETRKTQVLFGMRHSPAGGNRLLAGAIARAQLFDRALSPDEVAATSGATNQTIAPEELLAHLTDAQRAERSELQAKLDAATRDHAALSARKVFCVTPQGADVGHLLHRGNPLEPREVVAPGGVASLVGLNADFGLPPNAPESARRVKLAQWITDPHNALFQRTIVNRVWHYHFGQGLVATPSDLGFNAGAPSHPELLDWLAADFAQQGMHLKALHRQIVRSATYRQSAQGDDAALAQDADNRWLWRKTPQRLEAEAVRDAILSVAGELNPALGGPSFQDFKTYQHRGTQIFDPLDPIGPEFNRRSLYRMWARGGRNPLLDTFDCPDPSITAPERGVTTTPLQSLAMLNNSFVLRMSDHFASRLQKSAPDNLTKQIDLAFELTYGRPPTDDERHASAAFADQHGLPALCRVLFNSNGFLYVE